MKGEAMNFDIDTLGIECKVESLCDSPVRGNLLWLKQSYDGKYNAGIRVGKNTLSIEGIEPSNIRVFQSKYVLPIGDKNGLERST